ncbi:MAG: efflux RND transporter permease subunit [Myxococcales bacterium]
MTVYDPDRAPLNRFFVGWAETVLRFRWPLLVLTLTITAVFAHQAITKRRIDTSIEAFLSTDSEAFHVLERMRDDFGRDEMFLLLIEGDVFSEPYLNRLKALHDELAALDMDIPSLGERKSDRDRTRRPSRVNSEDDGDAPAPEPNPDAAGFGDTADEFGDFGDDEGWGDEAGGTVIDEIISLVNARETTWRGGGLHVGGLLDEWPTPQELPALKQRVLSEHTFVGRVVAKNGRHSSILLRTDFMSEEDSARVYAEIKRIVDRHETEGFHIRIAGLPALEADISNLMLSDLARMGIIGVTLMVLMMAVMFRHPLGVLGPVLVVVQAVVWTLGVMAALGVPMTIITNVLPAFVICVGIGDSVHIQSVYRDAMGRGASSREAVVHAIGTTGIPVLFTTMTTAMGLLSFRLATVDAIRELGAFGALGVSLALLHTLVFLPIVLSFNRKSLLGLKPDSPHRRDLFDRFLAFCNGFSRPREGGSSIHHPRRFTLLSSGVIGLLSLVGAAQLTVYHNPLTWIPDRYPIKDAFDAVDANLGGTADTALLIETRPGKTLRDRELMLALSKLEEHVLAYEHPTEGKIVGNVISILDVIRESNRATHESRPEEYRIPDTERGVADMLTLFESAGPDELQRLATIDLKRSVMTVRLHWMDASSYAPFEAYIERGIEEYVGDRATIEPTGSVLNLLTVVGGLLRDLMRSFGTAFIVITVMMVILLKDLRLGLIAMVPNLLPIAAVMGFMGFAGIPIDLNNILIGSIAIGIAVDDTIHFLHQFRAHIEKHEDVESALEHSFSHAGRAMITTSIILVAGFMVFMAASMYNLQRFGLLVALTLVLALLVDLIFAPALLRTFYGDGPSKGSNAPGGDHAKNAPAPHAAQ